MTNELDEKSCQQCGLRKPLSEFRRLYGSRDGYAGKCRSCWTEGLKQTLETTRRVRIRQRLNESVAPDDTEFCSHIQALRRRTLYPTPRFIYALLDPRTAEIRYVGQTHNPEKRLQSHLGQGSGENKVLRAWIEELRLAGLQPDLEILEQVDDKEFVLEREFRWIVHLALSGAPLANSGLNVKTWRMISTGVDVLTEPRNSSTMMSLADWFQISKAGDDWGHGRLCLSEAIDWCMEHCPSALPEHLREAARMLGYEA